jgi:trehalose 6-phosphate phosphatase
MRWGTAVERTARAPVLLVATDFDGTLSAIVSAPELARPRPLAIEALSRLAACPGVSVVVASGRPVGDLRERLGADVGAWLVGEHGASVVDPRGHEVFTAAPPDAARLDALVGEARRLAGRVRGISVERKQFGVAVHLRGVDARDRVHAARLAAAWAERARAEGLALLAGRLVIEAHAPSADKGAAVARVLAALDDDALLLAAGDDTTDEPALALARARGGAAVYVASSERPRAGVDVDETVGGPDAWIALLAWIAAARSAPCSASSRTSVSAIAAPSARPRGGRRR